MRTFSQYRAATSATRALKWTSATRGVMMPCCFSPSEMLRIFSASRTPCVVSRTSSPPALMMRRAWLMQASVSLVFVVVIDWTRMGESLPIVTLPTWVVVVCLRCMVYGGGGWLPCGVWGLPCGDWIAAVVTAQWLMFEARCLLEGGACLAGVGLPCGWWACLAGGAALRVVPALRVCACPEGLGWGPALRG